MTIKNFLTSASPPLTDQRLENQPPKAVPTAKISPIFQSIASLKANTAKAAMVDKIVIIALMALLFTNEKLLTDDKTSKIINPTPAWIKPA